MTIPVVTYEDRLIRADWHDERDANAAAEMWRCGFATYAGVYIDIGSGIGIGSGINIGRGGIGSGSGSGSGIGRGIGRGIGIGRGSGSGRGSGRGRGGSGSGSGRGSGSGIELTLGRNMNNGQAYLVFCGDWHAFVGIYEETTSPLLHRFSRVSKIVDTHGGDVWEKLCSGDESARAKAEYRHYSTAMHCPVSIAAFEWVGDVPNGEGKS